MQDLIYVILNGSLNMSPGKAAAQAVHAAMMLNNTHRTNFISNTRRTVIVLEAKNRDQLDGIADYLTDASIDYQYYIDEGVNEVDAFSFTALVVEPISSDDTRKREIFAGLRTFGNDDYDENGGYTEPMELTNNYAINAVRADLQALRTLLTPPRTIVKPKWYQRFRRKRNGWVS